MYGMIGQSRWQWSAAALVLAAGMLAGCQPAGPAAALVPQRVILTWADSPVSTQAVCWRTDGACVPRGQVLLATAAPDFTDSLTTVAGATQIVKNAEGQTAYCHTVNFKGLRAGELYVYRVGDGKTWSEWNQFRTAPAVAGAFRFIYLGDMQDDDAALNSRAIRAAYAKAPDAAFIAFLGDLVNAGDNDRMWKAWFEAGGWVYRNVPSLPVIGNHEQADDKLPGDFAKPSIYWRAQFAVPQNGPAGLEGLTYYVDYQGTRLVALDGSRDLEAQAAWLDKVLTDNPNRWTIVMIHQSLFPTGKLRDGVQQETYLMPVFERHHVDLVLSGHEHVYGRTGKVADGKTVANDQPGVVYCVSMAGPKMYKPNPRYRDMFVRFKTDTQLYQVLSVDAGAIGYESRDVTGKLVDSFKLTKAADGSTRLVEMLPTTAPAEK
jgi:3',5'-cyclic AMP phosphodiesterase CpdA